jgi:hypothetical protein
MDDADFLIPAMEVKGAALERVVMTGVNVPNSKPSLLSRITEASP